MTSPEQNNQSSYEVSITNIPLDYMTAAIAASDIHPTNPSLDRFLSVAKGLETIDRQKEADALASISSWAFRLARTQDSTVKYIKQSTYRDSYRFNTPRKEPKQPEPSIDNIVPNKEAVLMIDLKPDSHVIKAGDKSFLESVITIALPIKDGFAQLWSVVIKIHFGQAELHISKTKVIKQGDQTIESAEEVSAIELQLLADYLQPAEA
jgi:hypothetical protein